MIFPRIRGATAASSHELSPRVVSPAVYADIPSDKSFTYLKHSNRCRKSCIKAQSNMNPIPNASLSKQKDPINIYGPSAMKTMPVTITPPNDMFVEQESGHGIGIVEFLAGKNYFITGATGLLAKGKCYRRASFSVSLLLPIHGHRMSTVFIEKVLRMSPDVGKIYVLIRAKDEETAVRRLKEEVIDSEVFQHQRRQYGDKYEEFMLGKLFLVVGDIGEPNLGIGRSEVMNRIIDEVDVFVNSAANTVLDESYDVSLNMNTSATLRALELAKQCKKLRIFLHVSTAYVNGTRQGILPEKHFEMGQSITAEKSISNGRPLPPPLNVHEEIRFAKHMVDNVPENEAAQKMKEVGMARATFFGWQNTYQFTKAMAEMVVHEHRGEVPVVIVRPGVIEGTFQEPFPGWIQGNRVLEPVIITYGKGRLPGALADPEVVLDIVPLDVVVNTMVASMVKHGKYPKPGLHVYHATSSMVNPCTMYDLFRSFYLHFASSPMKDAKGNDVLVEEVKFFDSVDEYQAHAEKDILQKGMIESRIMDPKAKPVNGLERKYKRVVESITHLGKLYEPYFFNKVRFDNSNTEELIKEMSGEERKGFRVDMRGIDWEDYFVNIHIPGVRKHVLKKPIVSHGRA
ncbi:hypothetical protein MLD38_036264 [Melastoma candidum]|uniref:Uncharacterized protein n=1 Tax=Melastoma candidum TaxID=119954 RepID=A0ACB9LL11_9MYRT|nr:hypothetical protein MLD38_036264 [Melastoma candidum]